jgi:hypothetical protein
VSLLALPPPETLKDARSQANMAYYFNQSSEDKGLGAGLDGPDTLDKVEAPAWALLELLDEGPDNINWLRLLSQLTGDDPDPSGDRAVAVVEKLHEFLRSLDAVRLAARKAHQKRRRGRPGIKDDLRAAAYVLIEYWGRTHGGKKFTNADWNGLEAIGDPAKFLFDELRLIDPKRPRLASQLKGIMAQAVAKEPGTRRGRKRSRANNKAFVVE